MHEGLARAEHLGDGRQLGRDCDRFLFTHLKGDQDPVSRVYWLDRATGITVRLDYYENEKKRSENKPDFTWSADALASVNGRHLTLNSHLRHFDDEGGDPERVLMEYRITTDEITFDHDYPTSTFWPAIAKNTTVIDSIKNTVVFPNRNANEVPTTAAPIRAVDPPGWGLSLSSAGLILGLAALGAGLLLWWRRN